MDHLSRRQFLGSSLALVGLGLHAGCGVLPPRAQEPAKIPRIGFLAGSSAAGSEGRLAALQQGLRELGYVEGTSFTIESRYAGGDADRLPELAVDLIRLKEDILVVQGTPAAQAAKQATSVIPIVIGNATDPVGAGLVASLAGRAGTSPGCRTSTSPW